MLVSVVIPTHHRENLLLEAIESVKQQTYRHIEIIVVDDARSEKTRSIVEEVQGDFPIRYLPNNEGSGASSSRNLGIRHATGELIAFLDDDDSWFPEKIDRQVHVFMERPGVDAVFCGLRIQYPDLGIEYDTNPVTLTADLREICLENYLGATISCMCRSSVLISVGGFDEKFPAREEYDLWIRLIASGAVLEVIPESLCFSRGSFSRQDRISSSLSNYIFAIDLLNEKHKELIENVLSSAERRTRSARQSAFLASQAAKIGAKYISIKYWWEAFRKSPSLKYFVAVCAALLGPRFMIRMRAIIG